jgi:hypothetical protein
LNGAGGHRLRALPDLLAPSPEIADEVPATALSS